MQKNSAKVYILAGSSSCSGSGTQPGLFGL